MFHLQLSAVSQFSHMNYEYNEPIDYVNNNCKYEQVRKN